MNARAALGLSFAAMALAVGGAEALGRMLTRAPALDEDTVVTRAANVVIVSKSAANLPPRPVGKSLWLLGNSHTYALPGLHPGEPLRNDPGVTLIDELARALAARAPARSAATYYRMANPNLLPTEMLVRTAQWVGQGYRPEVVVLGLTWRNVARDAGIRHDLATVFRDPAFVASLRAFTQASPALGPMIDAEVRRVEQAARAEQMKSSADHLDERATREVGRAVALVGQSAGLRATVYRAISYGLIGGLLGDRSSSLSYDVVADDLALNTAALEATVKLLRGQGASVVVYLAPERTDLPAMMAGPEREAFEQRLGAFLTTQGAVLIDARDAVPNEHWGWEMTTPDRSHFTEPGHRLLAERLVSRGEAAGAFAALDSR